VGGWGCLGGVFWGGFLSALLFARDVRQTHSEILVSLTVSWVFLIHLSIVSVFEDSHTQEIIPSFSEIGDFASGLRPV